jgi:hypothetical protein
MIIDYLFSCILILTGYFILTRKEFHWKGMIINISNHYLYIIVGGTILILGFLWLYSSYKLKQKKEYFTICPKCKESFNYNDLKNGKCLYCENIDTIDIEEYYKENKINEDKDEK